VTAFDSAAASVFVRVPRQEAFDVFTQELDDWWRHGRKYRIAGARPGRLVLECKLGGRLFEEVNFASGAKLFVTGEVLEWSPPEKVAFEWRNVNFKPHERTLVVVTFTPRGDGTMVRVEHSGFAALPDNHPVRHGAIGADFCVPSRLPQTQRQRLSAAI
jgi:uncharacterized protein YndB with AHSA1/START domain